MPPKKKRPSSKYAEDDFVDGSDSGPDTKRKKSDKPKTSTAQKKAGEKSTDEEGNTYWELGGRLRRVTLSSFKGKTLVNIREHYEKDGKVLPGKKGISLSMDQFNALMGILPQMIESLESQQIEVVHPAVKPAKEAPEKEASEEEAAEAKQASDEDNKPEPSEVESEDE